MKVVKVTNEITFKNINCDHWYPDENGCLIFAVNRTNAKYDGDTEVIRVIAPGNWTDAEQIEGDE